MRPIHRHAHQGSSGRSGGTWIRQGLLGLGCAESPFGVGVGAMTMEPPTAGDTGLQSTLKGIRVERRLPVPGFSVSQTRN
jgi:hypothetical protein